MSLNSFKPNGLHGLGDLAPDMRERSELNAKADAAGFAVAYPNAQVWAFSDVGDLVAAVAVVAGTLTTHNFAAVPNALQPVSMIILHRELDGNVVCCPLPKSGEVSQDDTFNYWVGPRGTDAA